LGGVEANRGELLVFEMASATGLCLISLAVLLGAQGAIAATATICIPLGDPGIFNIGNGCGGAAFPVNINPRCNSEYGFTFTDITGCTVVTGIDYVYNHGVDCTDDVTHSDIDFTLNTVNQFSIHVEAPETQCSCVVSPLPFSGSFSQPSAYNIGGLNTFSSLGAPGQSCQAFMDDPSSGCAVQLVVTGSGT